MLVRFASLQPARAETFGQRHEVLGTKGVFEFRKRPECQNEPPSCAADIGLDLAAVAIGHGSSLIVTEK